MRVGIDGHIRGEPIHIDWVGGIVDGDLELVDRARRMYLDEHGQPIDESDPAVFISALEHASPEHLHIEILGDIDPEIRDRLWSGGI
jgi:hypothetical protein